MDDEALRTHHVIAALVIGAGFAAMSVIASPVRRLRQALSSVNFAGGRSGPDHGGRILHRMDEPLA